MDSSQPKTEFKDGLSKKAKMLIFGGIGLVVVALALAAVYAYFNFYQSPERVGGLMMQNLTELKSFSYSAEIRPRFADTEFLTPVFGGAVESVAIRAHGVASITTDKQPRANAEADIVVESANAREKTYSIETRLIEGILYVLAKNPSEWDLPAVDTVGNRWVTLDLDAAGTGSAAKLSTQEKVQIRNAFRDSSAIQFGDKVGSETIHDVATTQYAFTLTTEGIKAFVAEVKPILVSRGICTETQCAEMVTKAASMQDMNGEVWIGKKDYQPYQVRLLYSLPEDASIPLRDVVISMTMWNHNAGVAVEVPSPTVPWSTLVSEFMGSIFGGSTNTNSNLNANLNANVNTNSNSNTNASTNTNTTVNIDEDDDGLTTLEEERYGTDPDDADSDNDGYDDGEEVDNGYNPLGAGELE